MAFLATMVGKLRLDRLRQIWARDGIPARVHLALFAAMLLVPALLLSGFLIREAANERRREAEVRVVQLASDLADDVSKDLERSLTILRTLSVSQALAENDLKAFYELAQEMLASRDEAIILVDADGRQILNSGVPWHMALSPYSDLASLRRAVETRGPVVTDMFWGRLRNRYVINLLLPIVEAGGVKRVLAYSITPDRIRRMIQGQNLGPDWSTGVADRNNRIIARSQQHDRYVGTVLGPEQLRAAAKPRTAHSVTSIDGRPVVRAVAYTRLGNWMVGASVSEAYLGQLVAHATRNLVIGTAIILGLATSLVFLYGRQLTSALGSITGAVSGDPHVTIIREATAAARALSAAAGGLRQSEERFRGIYLNAATGIAIRTPDGHFQACNPAYARLMGYSEDELLQRRVQDLIHPQDRAENARLHDELLSGRRTSIEIELRYIGAGDRTIWVHKHVSVVHGNDGAPRHVIALVTDRTERLKYEQDLAIAVERSRIAQQSAKAALYELVPRTGHAQFDPAFAAVTGFTQAEMTTPADARAALVHPEDAASVRAAMHAGIASGTGYDIVYRLRHKAGHYLWIHDRASLLTGPHDGDARVIGMMLDISEAKAREEHVNLLLREVNHRSKNMLGLVLAIARQTAAADASAFLADFTERIQALSANQDLLVSNDWSGVAIDALVSAQLSHFMDVHATRITAEGPRIQLTPAAAQVLGMALHELATNASKYGALANAQGCIRVAWSAEDGAFSMSWQEEGGPEVVRPARTGFGTTVLKAMATMSLDAEVELSYPPSGLRWRLTCPLDKVIEAAAQDTGLRASAGRALPPGKRRSRILVVEDEALIAMEITDILAAENYEVVGPSRTVEQALALFHEYGCDMAVLDVSLGAQTAEPVARELADRAIPFLLVSGYDRDQQPAALRASPLVKKPIRPETLIAEVRKGLSATAA
ncbi:MAG: PAS domain-containing protein [Hyphomicrobiaceae bacterium]|nr:PAS domain-containing protein [Hyphomicrobiaceae bacterium]